MKNIFIEGNRKTKEYIILRELTFRENDTIDDFEKKMRQSEKNLMNTSLFNFATIETSADTENPVFQHVKISLTERWYLWPVPIFELAETNFNTWWQGKNLSRTNYGLYMEKQNFRGRKEVVRFLVQLGFTEKFALQYQIPYINKKQTLGVMFTTGYWGNHEVNFSTTNNKRQFLKDSEKYLREEFYSRLTFTYRKELYTSHVFELQYINGKIADTVSVRASDYFKRGNAKWDYLYALWQYRHDKRDYKPYPLEGYFYGIDITKYGLGILKHEPNSLMAYFSVAKYHKLSDKFYFANGASLKLNFLDAPSYSFQRGLGYSDFVRGYEYYVIDGQDYGLFKANIKYELLKSKEENIEILKNERFSKFFYSVYLNVFGDAGYVRDKLYYKDNFLANSMMLGGGIGLDFMTYYDIVLRTEFSVNRMKEPGFYLHFVKPI